MASCDPPPVYAVALLLQLLTATATLSRFPTGCIVRGRTWYNPGQHQPVAVNVSDAVACQAACQSLDNCTNFSWWPVHNDCWLIGSPNWELRSSQDEVFTGPRFCDSPAACWAKPAYSFPGPSELEDWPDVGYQPQPLQCWPGVCDDMRFEQDVPAAVSWMSTCETWGRAALVSGEDCKGRCIAEAGCSSYANTADGACWLNAGFDCQAASSARMNNLEPESPHRVLRGTVRVLHSLANLRVPGLVLAFIVTDFTGHSVQDIADICAKICYSILACQYWQYNSDESSGGCYIQQVASSVPYPLTDSDMLLANPSWAAGEFIQHTCPPDTVWGVEVPEWATSMYVQAAAAVALCVICSCAVNSLRQRLCAAGSTFKTRSRSRSRALSRDDVVPDQDARDVKALPADVALPTFLMKDGSSVSVASVSSFGGGTPLLPMAPQIGTLHLVQALSSTQVPQRNGYGYAVLPQVSEQSPAGSTRMPVAQGSSVAVSIASTPRSSTTFLRSPMPLPRTVSASTASSVPARTSLGSNVPRLSPPALPRSPAILTRKGEEPAQWGSVLTVAPPGM